MDPPYTKDNLYIQYIKNKDNIKNDIIHNYLNKDYKAKYLINNDNVKNHEIIKYLITNDSAIKHLINSDEMFNKSRVAEEKRLYNERRAREQEAELASIEKKAKENKESEEKLIKEIKMVKGKEESKVSEATHECKVCMETECQVIFLNCGHICCCSSCSEKQQTCPVCRTPIVEKKRFFFA